MTCCTPSRDPVAADQAGADARMDLAGHETTGAPERAYFAATRTFVGTDNPQIPADGEGPRRMVNLKAFALEIHPVTNARFKAFIAATGYITEAEKFGWSAVFRGLMQDPPPPSSTATPWWVKGDGAFWAAPEGPGSGIADRHDHPVVHVSLADAHAFAQWCGGRLPSEAEWEHAARGGLADPRFPWGDSEPDDTGSMCNIWQGNFPHTNSMADGYFGTSPVSAFAPNGAGLYGMAGNVWEWTADAFRVRSLSGMAKLRNAEARAGNQRVCKGGSFLCHKSYCYRYRIAARTALTADSSASNNGFRIAYDG